MYREVCRTIGGDQRQVYWIDGIRPDAALDEHQHQYGDERDRKPSRRRHRIGLGERERLEQPTLLRLQCEDGEERKGDDQEREEQGRANPSRCLGKHLAPPLLRKFYFFVLGMFKLFVRVLDRKST